MEIVPYNGWSNNIRLTNGEIELIVTTDVGPRIIRLGYVGERNVFAELKEQLGTQGDEEWMIRGGHRFWIAPEIKPDTYEVDNAPVEHEEIPDGIMIRQPPGPITGVSKTLLITLQPDANRVQVVHTLTNTTDQAVEVAPWALSAMAMHGTAVIPLPARIPHAERLTHNQEWSLWGYTDLRDPRWVLGARYLLFRQTPDRGPNKLGIAHREGWVAYLVGDVLFVKRFGWSEGADYPDGGVNFETFANEQFLEIESLGPLVTLAPGESTSHEERWELHRGVPACRNDADVETHLLPRLVSG